ncbi:hypothetical protein MBLNU457_1693t1 [Dothideomycetes sp. NU457]
MPGMVWDAVADRKLLLAVISVAKVAVNNDEIATKLGQDLGTTLTGKAISNRLYRLKQMADGSANGDGTTKATAGKGGKKRAAADDDDSDEKPVKKTIKRAKATTKAKVEEDNEDDADVGAVIKSEASEEAEE